MLTMILLGLAVWIATCILVEAEIFRDLRDVIDKLHNRYDNWATYKLRYLVHCHMCSGIWIAGIVALFVPPVASSGLVGWALTALAIKGIAHLFLVVHKLGESWTGAFNAKTGLNECVAEKVRWLEDTRHSYAPYETWKQQNVNTVD